MLQILIGNLVFFPVYAFILNYILLRLIPRLVSLFAPNFNFNIPEQGLKQLFRTSICAGLICGIAADVLFIIAVTVIN